MKNSVIDLGDLASRKKFHSFTDHPYTNEEDVPFFNFLGSRGSGGIDVQGSDNSELVVLTSYDDLANMGKGDDVAVGAFGADTLNGGDGNDYLFGYTDVFIRGIVGDDDVLSGDDGNDLLVGDSPDLIEGAVGGADTLIGGTGDDTLFGDGVLDATSSGGADVFVFAPGSGDDVIKDFRLLDGDVIDVSAYGFDDVSDMVISSDGTDTTIVLSENDSITLAGFADHTALANDDFAFV